MTGRMIVLISSFPELKRISLTYEIWNSPACFPVNFEEKIQFFSQVFWLSVEWHEAVNNIMFHEWHTKHKKIIK